MSERIGAAADQLKEAVVRTERILQALSYGAVARVEFPLGAVSYYRNKKEDQWRLWFIDPDKAPVLLVHATVEQRVAAVAKIPELVERIREAAAARSTVIGKATYELNYYLDQLEEEL